MVPKGVHSLILEPGSKRNIADGIRDFAIILDSLDGSSVVCDPCLGRKELGSL